MDAFRKVKAGDKTKASPARSANWLNAVSRSTEYYQKQIEGGDGGGGANGLKNSSGLVKVKNLIGDDLIRGKYVQLGDYLLTDVDHRYQWYEGNLYDKDKPNRIAILTTAIPDTKIGEARILGRCSARVNVSDITHRFAKPDDAAYLLISATNGPVEILSQLTGTGEQEVTVILGGGGGGGGVVTVFAVVTNDADADGGSIGKAVLLNDAMNPIAADDSEFADVATAISDAVDADKVEFKSAHDVACKSGVRVILHSFRGGTVSPGIAWADQKVWGTIVNPRDYLAAVSGFASEQILFSAAGTAGSDIVWDGESC